MTTACALTLGLSLVLYLAATLLFVALFCCVNGMESLERRALVGVSAHIRHGATRHPSGQSPFFASHYLAYHSAVVGRVAEHHPRKLPEPPGRPCLPRLLYPMLAGEQPTASTCVRIPLGVRRATYGYVGFALAFCTAAAYLLQRRAPKRGRLNHYLPC